MNQYYFSATESRLAMSTGPYSLSEIKEILKDKLDSPLKLFSVFGEVKGTLYPNGETEPSHLR